MNTTHEAKRHYEEAVKKANDMYEASKKPSFKTREEVGFCSVCTVPVAQAKSYYDGLKQSAVKSAVSHAEVRDIFVYYIAYTAAVIGPGMVAMVAFFNAG